MNIQSNHVLWLGYSNFDDMLTPGVAERRYDSQIFISTVRVSRETPLQNSYTQSAISHPFQWAMKSVAKVMAKCEDKSTPAKVALFSYTTWKVKREGRQSEVS